MPKLYKHNWSLVFTGSSRSKGSRAFEIPGFLVVFFVLAVAIGLAGFGRMVYLGSNYALVLHDAAEQRRMNEKLLKQVDNLEKFVNQKAENIAVLVAYEDNARIKYGLEAISSDIRKAGVGGLPTREEIFYASLLNPQIVRAEALRRQAVSLNYQAALQESTLLQVSGHAEKVHKNLAKRPAIWPTTGRLTSTFGFRYHPLNGMRRMHEGIDIANSVWTPIYATADGQVSEFSSYTHFGNMVKIKHNNEYTTLYAHLHKVSITQGQIVKRGDVIGYMGNTGLSTGSHLHYEVHRNGHPINPMSFILPGDHIVD